MPIHLIYGDDYSASNKAIEQIIQNFIDPNWISFNLSRLDGNQAEQSSRCIDEIRTPPFGNGGRVVLLKRSPFCNGSTNDLSHKLEDILDLIPCTNHLILNNTNKPDKRLKLTKSILKVIKESKGSSEQLYMLPAVWDESGQIELIQKIGADLNLKIEQEAIFTLVEAIGNDSTRIHTELQKLSLLSESNKKQHNLQTQLIITNDMVKSLIHGITANSLNIADCILKEDIGNALNRINSLLESGEPALKILATLVSQARGWLWVKLLDEEGNHDVTSIAKLAGIGNPKRIYVIRKQIKGKSSKKCLQLLDSFLEIEAAIKQGVNPSNAFKDILLTKDL